MSDQATREGPASVTRSSGWGEAGRRAAGGRAGGGAVTCSARLPQQGPHPGLPARTRRPGNPPAGPPGIGDLAGWEEPGRDGRSRGGEGVVRGPRTCALGTVSRRGNAACPAPWSQGLRFSVTVKWEVCVDICQKAARCLFSTPGTLRKRPSRRSCGRQCPAVPSRARALAPTHRVFSVESGPRAWFPACEGREPRAGRSPLRRQV